MLQVHENMNIRLMNSFFLNAITTLKSDTHQMQHATTTMKHFNLNSNLGLSWTIWTFQHICFNCICWTWLYVTFRYALLYFLVLYVVGCVDMSTPRQIPINLWNGYNNLECEFENVNYLRFQLKCINCMSRCTGEPGSEELLSKHFIQHGDRWRQVHTLNDIKTRQRHGENWGLIKGDITRNTWNVIKTQTGTNKLMTTGN